MNPVTLSVAVAALAAAGGLALAQDVPTLRAMHWAAKDADPIRAFATAPTECLKPPADPDLALQVEVGRAAFRTPLLLGGQAARAGLACETCHRGGRSNPDFQFPGVSGGAGTADVTNSLFSSHRGDGIDNPKPIPDLSGPRAQLKISRAAGDPALGRFIHGLVTEEFDGPEPPKPVMAGLVAYVRALDPTACPAAPREPVNVRLMMSDARRAVAAARAEAARGEAPTAVLLLSTARARLGQIDERFAGPDLAPLRARLRVASAQLAQAQAALRRTPGQAPGPGPGLGPGSGPGSGLAPPGRDLDRSLARWPAESRRLEAALAAAEPASLFAPARLAAAAKRRLPD